MGSKLKSPLVISFLKGQLAISSSFQLKKATHVHVQSLRIKETKNGKKREKGGQVIPPRQSRTGGKLFGNCLAKILPIYV